MGSEQTPRDSTPAADQKEERVRRLYGNAPARSDLLHNQLQRRYFDSGDYALQGAHKSSSMGSVQTGTEHPLRNNISHPSAPVPTSSNLVDAAAGKPRDAARETDASGPGTQPSSRLREVTGKDSPSVD
ncbi:hypothetical protein LX36DRAFT_710170 [Colletotrichum falcatum]|nr:hypothetical protein LX36DRAFT_710170 [Colletotrichum falcatum]